MKREINGLIHVDKPKGLSSRRVVDLVGQALGTRKLGHAGTLDPLATGILVLAAGQATRLIEAIQEQAKSYQARVRLGARSNTDDADGLVEESPIEARDIPTLDAIERQLQSQVGLIQQRPPGFSALRIEGRRAYDLARAGEALELAARPVRVDRIAIVAFDWPWLELEIDCGSGTYIRSIARDLGEALACGGLIQELRRTRIGRFSLENALRLDDLSPSTAKAALRPMLDAVRHWPQRTLTPEDVRAIEQGRPIAAREQDPPGRLALVHPDGELLALAEVDRARNRIQPRRVLRVSAGP